MSNVIFVFGSNRSGIHGASGALYARQHCGAILGQGEGIQGKSYGIPTKCERLRTLSLDAIAEHVERFKDFARRHPTYRFEVTAIGCGLAGYLPAQIAPMFRDAPDNCELPSAFRAIITTMRDDDEAETGETSEAA